MRVMQKEKYLCRKFNHLYHGNLSQKLQGTAQYTSFIPAPLSTVHVEEELLAPFVSEAQEAIDQLNQTLCKLEEEEVQKVLRKEAEASWMLAAGKYFFPFGIPSFSSQWNEEEQEEIRQLTEASTYALDSLETLPLCGRLLKNAHYLMCQSDLYEKKYPGEFRNSPVWIGPEGCNLKNALFVPPTEEDMTEAFSELEKFIHEESGLHILIRAALIHYQLRPSILSSMPTDESADCSTFSFCSTTRSSGNRLSSFLTL